MSHTLPLRTMDQLRAEYALRTVGDFAKRESAAQVELRRYLIQLPALIRMNGLGQALAFYRSKQAASYDDIYHCIGRWLCEDNVGRVFGPGERDVLQAITTGDMYCYMAAQNEALALLEWLKKFATAMLDKDD